MAHIRHCLLGFKGSNVDAESISTFWLAICSGYWVYQIGRCVGKLVVGVLLSLLASRLISEHDQLMANMGFAKGGANFGRRGSLG